MYVLVSVCSYLGKRVIIDTWCVPVSICLIGLRSVLVSERIVSDFRPGEKHFEIGIVGFFMKRRLLLIRLS